MSAKTHRPRSQAPITRRTSRRTVRSSAILASMRSSTASSRQRSDEQLAISAIKAGASDYLRKPVSLRELKSVLDRFAGLVERRTSKMFKADSLQRVKLSLEIETSADALQPAVSQILRSIEGLVERKELMRIEVALQETLRNAFEHGNLGITYEQKMELCNNGGFEAEVERRTKIAQAEGKLIFIDVIAEKDSLRVQVTDQGKGFDWRAVPDPTQNPELLTGLHGRGIFLIRRCFETVTYNDAGNSITLERKLK